MNASQRIGAELAKLAQAAQKGDKKEIIRATKSSISLPQDSSLPKLSTNNNNKNNNNNNNNNNTTTTTTTTTPTELSPTCRWRLASTRRKCATVVVILR